MRGPLETDRDVAPLLTSSEYMKLSAVTFETYLGTLRFRAMRHDSAFMTATVIHVGSETYMSSRGSCNKRWSHWSNRGVRENVNGGEM